MEMTDRAAGWFWVLEKRRLEWQSDRQVPALNIHSNGHHFWITEKLVDGQRWLWCFLFCALTTGVLAQRRRSGRKSGAGSGVLKTSGGALFSLFTLPIDYSLRVLWCTRLCPFIQLVWLIWCAVSPWFKEQALYCLGYIRRLSLSAAFIYYAPRSSLWCHPGHYLRQCLVRLPLAWYKRPRLSHQSRLLERAILPVPAASSFASLPGWLFNQLAWPRSFDGTAPWLIVLTFYGQCGR